MPAWRIGQVLNDRYKLRERLQNPLGSAGGQSEVWRAWDQETDEEVAIKRVRWDYAEDAAFVARVRKENEFLLHVHQDERARNYSDHVVKLRHIENIEGKEFYVLEWLGDRTARDVLEDANLNGQPIDLEEVNRIAEGLLKGAAAAHVSDVLHRDIKPGNVSAGKTKKLFDFGSARNLKRQRNVGTPVGRHPGTDVYMSPEQQAGVADLTAESDVFSIGLVLFQLLSAPYFRHNPNEAVRASLARIAIEKKRAAVSDYNNELPRALDDVIRKATEQRPERRYKNAVEMLEAWTKAWLVSVAPAATPDPGTPAMPEAVPLLQSERAKGDERPSRPDSRRRQRRILIASGSSLVVLGLLMLWLFRGSHFELKDEPFAKPSAAIQPDTATKTAPIDSLRGPPDQESTKSPTGANKTGGVASSESPKSGLVPGNKSTSSPQVPPRRDLSTPKQTISTVAADSGPDERKIQPKGVSDATPSRDTEPTQPVRPPRNIRILVHFPAQLRDPLPVIDNKPAALLRRGLVSLEFEHPDDGRPHSFALQVNYGVQQRCFLPSIVLREGIPIEACK